MTKKLLFQKGDKVIRTTGNYNEMRVGDVDVVAAIYSSYTMDLQKHGVGHAPQSFRLLESKIDNWRDELQ